MIKLLHDRAMVAPCLSGSLGFDSARCGNFDFDKRFRICQPLLKSDTRNKSVQNQLFIIIIIENRLNSKVRKNTKPYSIGFFSMVLSNRCRVLDVLSCN